MSCDRERISTEALGAKEKTARAGVCAKGHVFLGADRAQKGLAVRACGVFGALDPKWATEGGGKHAYRAEAERYANRPAVGYASSRA